MKMNDQTKAPVKEKAVVAKDTIEGIEILEREYDRGKMPERKVLGLKAKLVELYRGKIISKGEMRLFMKILNREVTKGNISDEHYELFNRIEIAKADEECIVKVDDAPIVHFLTKGMICPFYKNHETDKYVIFITRKISPEWQLTKEVAMKRVNGHTIPEKDYPKERELLHRLSIGQKEFDAWFDYVEGDDVLAPEREQTYTF